MKQAKAVVRYYFDADILGLAKVIAEIRPDVTFPGDIGGVINGQQRGPCPITTTATKDRVWIPTVASMGLIIITRDKQIRRHSAEKQAVLDYEAKIFTIASTSKEGLNMLGNRRPPAAGRRPARKKGLNTWDMLEILMSRWRDIEELGSQKGPFIYAVYRTSISKVL